MHHIITSLSVLSFSLDAGPESLPALVYHLFENGLSEVSPDLLHSLLRLSQVKYWLLEHAHLHAAPKIVG